MDIRHKRALSLQNLWGYRNRPCRITERTPLEECTNCLHPFCTPSPPWLHPIYTLHWNLWGQKGGYYRLAFGIRIHRKRRQWKLDGSYKGSFCTTQKDSGIKDSGFLGFQGHASVAQGEATFSIQEVHGCQEHRYHPREHADRENFQGKKEDPPSEGALSRE